MKKWLLIIVGILVALFLGMMLAGAMLPEEHRASRTFATRQSPQAIWDAINDHANEPSWRSDVASVRKLPDHKGHPVWQENYKGGTINKDAATFVAASVFMSPALPGSCDGTIRESRLFG